MRTPRATIDFETRSAVNLKYTGSWRYSLDPTTQVLCLAYRLPHWPTGEVHIWHPAFPHLGLEESESSDRLVELIEWVGAGRPIEAHNAWFERGIWANIMVAHYGMPPIVPHAWRCSMAKASAHGLPRGLEEAVLALGLPLKKDMDGAKVMKKLMKPREPRKAEVLAWGRQHAPCQACKAKGKQKVGRAKAFTCPVCKGYGWWGAVPDMPLTYHETPEMFEALFAYCKQDVLSEEGLSEYLDDLPPQEQSLYLLDQIINERGIGLDRDGIEAALALIDEEQQGLNDELILITEGAVERATQRKRLISWFEEHGLQVDDTTAETLDDLLEHDGQSHVGWPTLAPEVRRAIEILRALGRSSTAKYVTMKEWQCEDGRAHGSMLYHGATTGRWSGAGIQPHNFPKGDVKLDMEEAWAVLKTRDREHIERTLGAGLMPILSSALRGAIVPTPGFEFYVADYAGIEARVVQWLAEDEEALAFFRTPGADPYCDMATTIFKRPIVPNKEKQPAERKVGKEAILGLGFQMGKSKFAERCAAAGIILPEDLFCEKCGEAQSTHDRVEGHRCEHPEPDTMTSAKVVAAYRAKFWRLVAMWKAQEEAAIEAVRNPRDVVISGRMTWFMDGKFLRCELPSGRALAYPLPSVRERALPWGGTRGALTYMGIDQRTRQWTRQWSYGGMLVENQTQAVARDLMADSLTRCEASGLYVPVLTVHDEVVAEAPTGKGDIHAFERLIAETPAWAEGLPVAAEGWKGPRYRK